MSTLKKGNIISESRINSLHKKATWSIVHGPPLIGERFHVFKFGHLEHTVSAIFIKTTPVAKFFEITFSDYN